MKAINLINAKVYQKCFKIFYNNSISVCYIFNTSIKLL